VSCPAFPMSAIVGQQELVQALLINAVAPRVGGVLIRGERGTAKSTAVRALAPLLEAIGDRPAPLVEVPLGATLDRLLGSLDLRRALEGEHRVQPGLLARANGGILYVDEVNLLPDHLVDALLDAAASGVARVERDAVSAEYAARFVLVGTMNVEEGELRPQLLDRFGLGVEVRGPDDPAARAEIVRRRMQFERDPAGFLARFQPAERELATRLAAARERLDHVHLPERELARITAACVRLGTDGVRGDIVWAQAAVALAALEGAEEVGEEHVRRVASLALSHRRRRDPLDPGGASAEELSRALDGEHPDPDPPAPGTGAGDGRSPATAPARPRRDPPTPAGLPPRALALDRAGRGPRGRRASARGLEAPAIDSRPAGGDATDIAVVATLRERLLGGVPAQGLPGGGAPQAVREHIRAGREGVLLCLVVDASGSMGARRRLARVKGALLTLLRDAYARRDRVAIVVFAAAGARLLVAPGAPLERAAAAIRALPSGGRTPLAAGLDLAARLIRREAAREPHRRAVAIVLTDGRVLDDAGAAHAAAVRLGRACATGAVHVIDTEEGAVRLGLASSLAAAAGGQHHRLRRAA
jgi:magnesium chelatase subunit D